ncbi:MAG: hypothetical protein RJA25_1588 [Bacteroidota bacterium]|jgi:hypothetical protein
MIVERTKKEVIIKLPNTTNIDTLQDIMDWIEFRELTKKSKATQKQVDNLVAIAKKNRWAKTKGLLSK